MGSDNSTPVACHLTRNDLLRAMGNNIRNSDIWCWIPCSVSYWTTEKPDVKSVGNNGIARLTLTDIKFEWFCLCDRKRSSGYLSQLNLQVLIGVMCRFIKDNSKIAIIHNRNHWIQLLKLFIPCYYVIKMTCLLFLEEMANKLFWKLNFHKAVQMLTVQFIGRVSQKYEFLLFWLKSYLE